MKRITISLIIFLGILFCIPNQSIANNPPDPPGDHGQPGDKPNGGGAPISGGVVSLVCLSVGYVGWKVCHKKKYIQSYFLSPNNSRILREFYL